MKNKVVTILAGAMTKADIKLIQGDVIGVDRGALFALENAIPIIAAIGDFDSVNQSEKQKIKSHVEVMLEYDRTKDASDTELAIQYAIKQKYKTIYVLGVIGTRLDHFLAVMHSLYRYPRQHIIILNATNHIQLLQVGKHRLAILHRYFTLLTFKATNISLSGAKYPLKNYTLQPQDTFTLSNEPLKKFIEVTVTRSPVFLMQASDTVLDL
jgi:thiamine pyrophosphokinase